MIFKQRLFSWFDSYDIYDEAGNVIYQVKGKLAWGHCLKIYDANGFELGTVKEKIFSFLPRFEIYAGEQYIGCITREWSLFKPRYNIDCNGWQVEGNFFEWDYTVSDSYGNHIAKVCKEFFNWTDTYSIDVSNENYALGVLMLVIAIDAEKCSRKD
jgi:uncharacterized protein YxjI